MLQKGPCAPGHFGQGQEGTIKIFHCFSLLCFHETNRPPCLRQRKTSFTAHKHTVSSIKRDMISLSWKVWQNSFLLLSFQSVFWCESHHFYLLIPKTGKQNVLLWCILKQYWIEKIKLPSDLFRMFLVTSKCSFKLSVIPMLTELPAAGGVHFCSFPTLLGGLESLKIK
jgi:hypothetical protein